MSVLSKPQPRDTTGIFIKTAAPAGQHLGVCVHAEEQFDVLVTKFDGTQEKQNCITFYFGLIGKDKKPYLVRTKRMKLSGHEKSNLIKTLVSWKGEAWNYADDVVKWAKERGGLLTIEQYQDKKGETRSIAKIVVPVFEGLQAPSPSLFAGLISDSTDSNAGKTQTPVEDEDAPF